MDILAPAKINLSLDITGRRPDGYHTLQMVMQSVSLYDKISVASTTTGTVEVCCNDDKIPCDDGNTVLCATKAFFAKTGIPRNNGLRFQINKQIPQQAGLGGGSADAAAALKLLDSVYHTHLTLDQLCDIGLSVGADVPFCLTGGTALVQGIGEKLQQITPMPPCEIVICRPPVGISTKEAYAAFDVKGCSLTHYSRQMLDALSTGNLSKIGNSLGNVFEVIDVPQDVLDVEKVMLSFGSLGACMTGSGSAVFGLFDNFSKASSCRDYLLRRYSSAFLCRPLSLGNKKALL